jgi:lactose/L-arabinose transport system permease protein
MLQTSQGDHPADPQSQPLRKRSLWDVILGPKIAPYLFIAPFFILFALFFLYPVLWSVVLSFQKWSSRETLWVGLDNYRFVYQLPQVHKAFANLVWYVIMNNVFQLTIATTIAVLIDSTFMRRFSSFFRIGYFIPNIVPAVVTAILFTIILGGGGVSDRFLELFGLRIPWLRSTEWSKPAVLLAGGWQWIGYWIVMLLAGLQGIPDEYYEAGEIDGATLWQRFTFITFPLLRPDLPLIFIVNTIGTMQLFEYPYLIFGGGIASAGGPLDSATTPVLELYSLGFQSMNLGGASALGWGLAVLIIVMSILQFTAARRRGWTE